MTAVEELLDSLTPFHLVLTTELRIRRVGSGLLATVGSALTDRPLAEVVEVVRPVLASDADLLGQVGQPLLVRLRQRRLQLRAQLVWLPGKTLALLGTPWLTGDDASGRAEVDPGLAAPHETWADAFMLHRLIQQQRADLELLVSRLEDREARLRAVIDTAVDVIVTTEADGTVARVNPAVEQLLGWPPDEIIGRNIALLVAAPSSGDVADATACPWGGRAVGAGCELVGIRKDGSVLPIELAVSQFTVRGHTYYTGIIRDISERKEIERLQNEFVSTVSHELRTPLTTIRGALGLVAAGVTGELPAAATRYVGMAIDNSDRLIRLINDLLDLEKVQHGRMEMRLSDLDLAAVVRQAVAANELFISGEQVRVELLARPAPGRVLGDADRLIQVILNLISNAVKFSPPGSPVELSVTRVGDRLRVDVRDHGPGLPESFRPRAFQRFAQADGSTTRANGGTGLGLTICRAIVEELGGTIDYESAPSGGTIFFFELPCLPTEPTEPTDQSDQTNRSDQSDKSEPIELAEPAEKAEPVERILTVEKGRVR